MKVIAFNRYTRVIGMLAAGALLGFWGAAHADIKASKHNLSIEGTGTVKATETPEICIFCHTPHAATKNDDIVLWNHELSATAEYTVYTSPTFDSTADQLGGATADNAVTSNLCLSCHDGTVAIGSVVNPSNWYGAGPDPYDPINGGYQMNTPDNKMPATSKARLDTDLRNDHPVNMVYSTADGTKHDQGFNTIDDTKNVKLFGGRVQCASCHDPHLTTNGPFLRASMTNSGLCLECHKK